MKPIEPGTILTCIIGFIFILGAVAYFLWVIFEWGKKQMALEDEYNALHKEINSLLDDPAVTSKSYDYIEAKITKLGQLKWKNREQTIQISQKFWLKFTQERLKRIVEKRRA